VENIDILDKSNKKQFLKYFDKTFFKGILAILIYYFIFNNFSSIVSIILGNYFKNISSDSPSYYYLNALHNFIVYSILLIALLLIYHKTFKNDYTRIKNSEKTFSLIICLILIMFAVNIFSNLIYQAIIKNVSFKQSENQTAINAITSYPIGYLIFAPITVFVAPIVEELIFRKSFFNVFKNKYVALIISVIVFGTMHVTTTYPLLRETYNQVQSFFYMLAFGIPYYASGLMFGIAYIKSDKNIIIPIAMHMANNYLATIMSTIIFYSIIF